MKLTAANVTRTLKNAGYEHEPKAYQAGFRTVTFKRNGGDVTILRRGCPVALHSYAHTLRAEGFTCEVDVDNNAVYVTA